MKATSRGVAAAFVLVYLGLTFSPSVGVTRPGPRKTGDAKDLDGMALVGPGELEIEAADGRRGRRPVSAFFIDRTEVTVAAYRACRRAGQCKEAAETARNAGDRSRGYRLVIRALCNANHPDRSDHPVNCVSWQAAADYCRWRGRRLPSEIEWEFAARSGAAERRFPWGEDTPTCDRVIMSADKTGCGRLGTWPVCSRTAGNSVEGACDLAGNVWEWTADEQARFGAGRMPWRSSKTETTRAIRGGSFASRDAGELGANGRQVKRASLSGPAIGFRCARSVR